MDLHDINDDYDRTNATAPLGRYGLLIALVLVCVGIWLVTRDAPAPKESAPSATPAK